MLRHLFNTGVPPDAGRPPYVVTTDWDDDHVFESGTIDGQLLTWTPAVTPSKASWRTLTAGANIQITVGVSTLTVAVTGTPTGTGTPDRLARWTGASTLGDSMFRDDGLRTALNVAINTSNLLLIGGTFAERQGVQISPHMNPVPNGVNGFGLVVSPTFTEGTSGNHPVIASVNIDPPVINNGAAATSLAASLRITGAPTMGGTNHALIIDGGSMNINGAGVSHSIGGAGDATAALNLTGAFTGSSDAYGVRLAHTLTPAVNGDGYLLNTAAAAQINKAGSGTHDTFATMILRPIVVGAGAAVLTNTATLKILAAPTGGTNNLALWMAAGPLLVSAAGPHAIGGGINAAVALTFGGSFAGAFGHNVEYTLSPGVGVSAQLLQTSTAAQINEAASGTHVDMTGILVQPFILNTAGGATTTNATSLKVSNEPSGATRNRALWVAGGLSQFDAIVTVSGAGGTVNTTNVGLEFRGSATPSLTAFNRSTALHLPVIYDALSHDFQRSGSGVFSINLAANTLLNLGGTFTGSGQSEMARMSTSVTGVAGTNIFGLIVVPTFVEAGSGTHGQLTAVYVAPTLTDGVGITTNVYGINIDTIVTGAVAPTVAAALRIAVPTGATTNYAILADSGSVRFASAGPHAIGTTLDGTRQLSLAGSFSPGATGEVLRISTSLSVGASGSAFGITLTPTFVEGTGGVHTDFYGMFVQPIVTAGTSTLTNLYGISVEAIAAQSGTTNAAALALNAPTGATNNFALWAKSGSVRIDSSGPHAIGGAPSTQTQLLISGTFSERKGLEVTTTMNIPVGVEGVYLQLNPTFVEAASGTHANIAALRIVPVITAGAATTTDAMGIWINTFAAATGTTNAAGLKIDSAPTGATSNYALWSAGAASLNRLDGPTSVGPFAYTTYTATYSAQLQVGLQTTGVGSLQVIGDQTVDGAVAALEFVNDAVGTGAEPRMGLIQCERAGANNTGLMAFYTINAGTATERLRVTAGGSIGISGSSFGSGVLVMFVANATTAPTTNPTGGGILYAEAGAGKWRGSGGTVTTFGPAEPHCPTCGNDFMHEWENERTGYLAVCMSCLTDEIGARPWIIKRAGRA